MGRPRLDLQAILSAIPGVKKVYFQPPATLTMEYPCIVYQLDDYSISYADNAPFRRTTQYMVTVIDRNPDSAIREEVADLPLCSFNRFFTADNLNHYVFSLFF